MSDDARDLNSNHGSTILALILPTFSFFSSLLAATNCFLSGTSYTALRLCCDKTSDCRNVCAFARGIEQTDRFPVDQGIALHTVEFD
jgi:hypothetical protein